MYFFVRYHMHPSKYQNWLLPGRRGTRRSLWKRAAAGFDELEPERWVSLTVAVEQPLRWGVHSPTRLDGREQDAAAWKEGNKGYRSDQIHFGGGARSGTRRGCGKIVASEDSAPLRINKTESLTADTTPGISMRIPQLPFCFFLPLGFFLTRSHSASRWGGSWVLVSKSLT